jgi:hypothetical protein
VFAAEEFEEAAKLAVLLRTERVRLLTEDQVAAIREAFPS